MQNIQLNSNRWDNIYSKLPNFEQFNNFLTLNKVSAPIAIALSAILVGQRFYPDSSALIGRVALWSCAAVVGVKGLLIAGNYIQKSIWSKTETAVRQTKEMNTWGLLAPPTDPQITDHRIRYNEIKDRIDNCFPEAAVFSRLANLSPGTSVPHPTAYTLNQLEGECEQWMQDSLAIAQAVSDDMLRWSDDNKFTYEDKPLTKGELLTFQPTRWMAEPGICKPFACPWLYIGFPLLAIAYRTIFNLSDGIPDHILQNKQCNAPYVKKEAEKFAANYPILSNKAAVEGWKAKFFEPGTKQYQWREQYNAAIRNILMLAGEIPDERFVRWAAAHEDGDFEFKKAPTSLPT